jgi:hypothetical protein
MNRTIKQCTGMCCILSTLKIISFIHRTLKKYLSYRLHGQVLLKQIILFASLAKKIFAFYETR